MRELVGGHPAEVYVRAATRSRRSFQTPSEIHSDFIIYTEPDSTEFRFWEISQILKGEIRKDFPGGFEGSNIDQKLMKFFLYIRKSTDEDDRQVLSLEAQEFELKQLASQEHLEIVEVFRESQTAKEPGRKVFNEMLLRIENGEVDGILSWHPDRLARNSVDGGRIIYLVDAGKIQFLKFPTFWFEPTPQGKFMLNIAFGQSKYFVDNLSENTRRGLRQKLRRGEWPGPAPIGYLNDKLNHTIVLDPERSPLLRKLFEKYAEGNYSLKDLQNIAKSIGLFSRGGKVLSVSLIQNILSNPFYYGVMRYGGELYEAKHEPLICKKLFDSISKIMASKSRPRKHGEVEYPLRGLFHCGECSCAITSEMQKGHHYYRCTKKRGACSQKYLREELLVEQVDDVLSNVSMPDSWAGEMLVRLGKEKESEEKETSLYAQKLRDDIASFDLKLDALLDTHLDKSISKEEYQSKKQKLLDQKIDLQEKLDSISHTGSFWLEPMRNFILDSKQAKYIASQKSLFEKRDFCKKVGSNLILVDKRVSFFFKTPWEILANFPLQNLGNLPKSELCTIRLRDQDSNLEPTPYIDP